MSMISPGWLRRSGSIIKGWLCVLGVGALVAATAAGCDRSKAELERVQSELTSVTANRDALKGELAESQERAARLEQRVAELEAKVAAVGAPPAAKPGAKAQSGTKSPKRTKGRKP